MKRGVGRTKNKSFSLIRFSDILNLLEKQVKPNLKTFLSFALDAYQRQNQMALGDYVVRLMIFL